MRKLLSGVTILGLVGFTLLLGNVAGATSGECTTFYNHSGSIPGSYDYAEFYEDGVLVATVQTGGVNIFVDPQQYGAGSKWDKVNKCHNGTTTTVQEESTTTLIEETTTTVGEQTTTTISEGITTTQGSTTSTGLIGSFWFASSDCQTLTAEWGDGITQVNVTQRLPEGDFDVTPFTESGQVLDTSNAFADSEWILVPVTLTGYTAVPDQISLFTEECTPSSRPPATTTTAPELPFTGSSTPWVALIVSGMATVLVGASLVKAFQEREDA